jgi:hypothetical protein
MYFLSLPVTSLEARRAWKDQSRCSFGNVGQRNCPSMPSLILRCRHRAHQRQKKGLLVSASYRESLGRAVQCLLRSEPADVCDLESKSQPISVFFPLQTFAFVFAELSSFVWRKPQRGAWKRRHASIICSNQSTPGLPYRDASKAQPLHILDATIFPHSLIGRLLQIQYPGRSRTA